MRKFQKIPLHLENNSLFIHRKNNNKRYKALTAWCETVRFRETRGLFRIIQWILGVRSPQVCSPLNQIDPNRRAVIYNYLVLHFENINSLKLIVIYQVQIYEFVPSYSYTTHNLTLILRRSRTGTVYFYTSTSNKRAARPKLYTKSLTRDLKLMYSRLTLMRISINL